jgi:hypothetical protein
MTLHIQNRHVIFSVPLFLCSALDPNLMPFSFLYFLFPIIFVSISTYVDESTPILSKIFRSFIELLQQELFLSVVRAVSLPPLSLRCASRELVRSLLSSCMLAGPPPFPMCVSSLKHRMLHATMLERKIDFILIAREGEKT